MPERKKRGRRAVYFDRTIEWIKRGGQGTAEECAAAIWGEATPQTIQYWRIMALKAKRYLRNEENIVWGLVKVNGYPGVYKTIENATEAYRMLDFKRIDTIGRTFEAINTLTATAEKYPDILMLAQPQARQMMNAWARANVALEDIELKAKEIMEAKE